MKPPRIRLSLRRTMLAVAVLGVLCYLAAPRLKTYRDSTGVVLSRCDFLQDVCEPIRIDDSIVWADGGSQGLEFTDSKSVSRMICLEDSLFGDKDLKLGSVIPNGKPVPIGGIEEKAFLGLLQRWVREDAEAQAWWRRLEARSRSDKTPFLTGRETKSQAAKAGAVVLMWNLLKRN